MEFNIRKCKVLRIGKSTKRIEAEYKMGDAVVQGASDEKEIGVIVQDDLSPRKHISKVVGGTY